MINPRGGSNKFASFFDFDTNIGALRFGVRDGKIFFQKNTNLEESPDISMRYVDGKMINQTFDGEIRLDNDLTHYSDYTVDATLEVALSDETPIIGGSAEIRFIGDGATTPTFSSDFTQSVTSDDYDSTEDAINKVVFYYDGTDAFYSITVL